MDGRRRQWIAIDVNFLGGDLGSDLLEEFGAPGPLVWVGFLCACKRNGVQGQISYTNEADAIAQLGLVGLELLRPLDDVFAFLGRRRQVRRERRGKTTTVVCKNWTKWQRPPGPRGGKKTDGTGEEDGQDEVADEKVRVADTANTNGTRKQQEQKATSEGKIAERLETNASPDINPDFDLDPDREMDLDLDTAPPARTALDDAMDLHHEQQERRSSQGEGESQLKGFIERLAGACTGENPNFIRAQAIQVIAMCNEHGPELAIAAAIREAEVAKGGSRLKLPCGLFPVFDRERLRRGLKPVSLRLPEIGKRSA